MASRAEKSSDKAANFSGGNAISSAGFFVLAWQWNMGHLPRALSTRVAPKRRRTRWIAGAGLVVAVSCSFPEYDFVPDGAAGASGSAGTSGGGAGGSAGTSAGSGGTGGVAGTGQAGMPDAGAAGEAGAQGPNYCAPVVADYPNGCYDGITNGNETNVDCGGGECQPCFQGSCEVDADCALGGCPNFGCTRRFVLRYTSSEQLRLAQKLSFQTRLVYENGSSPIPLTELRIRYYFRRNGVVEPIYVYNGNATLTQSGNMYDIRADVRWNIGRIAVDGAADYDTYLEISFAGPQSLVQGDDVLLWQEIYPGTTARTFDQATHYSYKATSDEEWPKITVYQGDTLVWGYTPRGGGKVSCPYAAFDFNGTSQTVGDQTFVPDSQSGATSSGSAYSQSPVFYPTATGSLAQILATGYTLTAGQSVDVPLANGEYLAYVYAFSSTGGGIGTITVEDEPLADFVSGVIASGQSWSKLGPLPVSVVDGELNVACTTGNAGISAVELRTPADASY